MKLYSIYNSLTEVYNPPFVARDDTDAIEIVRKAIIGGRDISLLVELSNMQLEFVGDFDEKNSMFHNGPAYVVILLDDINLPEHVQTLIDKLKKVELDVDTNGIKSFFYKLLAKCDEKKESKKKKKIDKEDEVKENQ